MSRTALLFAKQTLSYPEIRTFMISHGGEEVRTTRGGKYSFNIYTQQDDSYITVEFFPEYTLVIWDESDEKETAQIQEKLGGRPIMWVEIELSPCADPLMYEKFVFDFCTKWQCVHLTIAGEILSSEDIRKAYVI